MSGAAIPSIQSYGSTSSTSAGGFPGKKGGSAGSLAGRAGGKGGSAGLSASASHVKGGSAGSSASTSGSAVNTDDLALLATPPSQVGPLATLGGRSDFSDS